VHIPPIFFGQVEAHLPLQHLKLISHSFVLVHISPDFFLGGLQDSNLEIQEPSQHLRL